MADRRADPYLAFEFSVEIEQKPVAGFNEVSGLVFETEVETIRVGGVNDRDWQLAGPAKSPSRLVLKRGLGDIQYLWTWYQDIRKGLIKRRDVAIKLNHYVATKRDNFQDQMKRSWTFRQAFPVKWTGPEFRANTSAIAFEAIELVHRGLAD
jgi:phage tail-like protein